MLLHQSGIHLERVSNTDLGLIRPDQVVYFGVLACRRQCVFVLLSVSSMQARQRAGTLEEQVVDPSNTTRMRLLGGRIPEKEELVAKLQVSAVSGKVCRTGWWRRQWR